ncbi:unnamed protein product [marine sediment metagenome]|uniref:Uncharacterized protein n=1 Tax=marine sediment metagenome TaxID=412755 RepID=X1Q7H6_9ZZZZ
MIDCVENDIKQAFDEADTMEEFVETVVTYMTQISSEALSVLPQLVKVFCSEPAEELKKELKRRNG